MRSRATRSGWRLAAAIAAILVGLLAADLLVRPSIQPVTISFRTSGFEMVGGLQAPAGEGPHPAIIVVHGGGGGTRRSYRTMRDVFVSAGYAAFVWDKPGSGASRGEFSRGHTLTERASILRAAIAVLRKHPAIDPDRIGVWGISQAGYVIALALQQEPGIAFMMLVGSPGEDGVQQTGYFVGRQARCAGATAEQSAAADALAADVMGARTYDEYVASGTRLLERYPVVKAIDFMAGLLPQDRWTPRPRDGEDFFDPIDAFERTSIPALVIFGELDMNVDPIQGAAAYRAALARGGHARSRVIVIPKVDHDMVPSETGCMKERNARVSWQTHPGYLDAMTRWLGEIRQGPRQVP